MIAIPTCLCVSQGDEKCGEVLSTLFDIGVKDLLDLLPVVFQPKNILLHDPTSGKFSPAQAKHLSLLPHVQIQDEDEATEAPKVTAEEAEIKFVSMTAADIHNRLDTCLSIPCAH